MTSRNFDALVNTLNDNNERGILLILRTMCVKMGKSSYFVRYCWSSTCSQLYCLSALLSQPF